MTRNTQRRIEIACPVFDTNIKNRICEMLDTMLRDNSKAWEQYADGRYILRMAPSDMVINSQDIFIEQARTDSVKAASIPDRNKYARRTPDTLPVVPYVSRGVLTLIRRFFKN